MCYRTAKNKKLPFIAVLTSFLILGKIQDGGQDGNHCWWRHRPPAAPPPIKIIYLILLRRSKAFHWRQNRFEILQHMKNLGEGFHQPPPSCTTVGVWICVYVRGLSCPFLSYNTRHKSLKLTPFLVNFLENSWDLLITLFFSVKYAFSLPNVEPRVFWSTETTVIPQSNIGEVEMHLRASRFLTDIVEPTIL